jgi:hypothetical protein
LAGLVPDALIVSVTKGAACHPERSEGARFGEILRHAQNDNLVLPPVRNRNSVDLFGGDCFSGNAAQPVGCVLGRV